MSRRRLFHKGGTSAPVGSAVSKLAEPIVLSAVVGVPSTFTATSVTGTAPITRSWRYQVDGVNVGSANVAYTPILGDVGKDLTIVETVSNPYGSDVVGTSAGVEITIAVETALVGDQLYVNLPAGMVATIYVQRDGVDIADAVSAAASSSYAYTVVPADDGHALTPRLASIAWDTDAPRQFATYIAVAEPNKIAREYDESLDPASVPAVGDFTLGGTVETAKTITAVAIVDNIVKVTVSSNFVPGDQPTLTYTPGANPLRDLSELQNEAAAFSDVYVANQFPPPPVAVVLKSTDLHYAVGGGGFVNNGISGNFNYGTDPALPEFGDHGIRLTDDGWIEMQVADSSAVTRAISFGGTSLSEMNPCARLNAASVRAYVANTAVGTAYVFASPSSACRVRVARAMPSGAFTMDTSEDSGSTWSTRHTFVAASVEALAPRMLTNSAVVAIRGVRVQNFVDRGY